MIAPGLNNFTTDLRELVRYPDGGRRQHQRCVQVDDGPLLHQGDGLERVSFALLAQNDLEDVEQADRGDDKPTDGLDGARKLLGAPVAEVLEPCRGVDDVGARAF